MIKSLYVCRPLLNGEEFIEWAKSQGFTKTLSLDDFHVTIAFSRSAVDWDSLIPQKSTIVVNGHMRTVESLGDDGAVVVKFQSDFLPKRWQEFKDAGASWDYETYQPHISVTYDGDGIDLSNVQPYTGSIVLGPEKFEELNLDYIKNTDEAE
jgi:hypothetical protein